jgi:hypothetical protein
MRRPRYVPRLDHSHHREPTGDHPCVTLEVDVCADVDVRGTLVVDRAVPVGFQTMRCQVTIPAAEGTDPGLLEKLLAAAEYSCVNLQTLRSGVVVELGVTSS